MKLIQRYYLKEFFKLFVIIGFGLGSIFSLIELIDKINDFIPYNPSMKDLLLYCGLNFPKYVLYLMPMSALISGLFVFGQAGRKRETVAIRAAGGGIKALLLPFVYLGVILTAAAFLLGEFIVPDFSRKAHLLRDSLSSSKRNTLVAFKEGTVWSRAGNAIIKIDLFMPDKGIIRGISIMKMEDDKLVERIEAESAEWRPAWKPGSPPAPQGREGTPDGSERGIWYLRGATEYNIRTGTITKHSEIPSDLIRAPQIFREKIQKPEEMNIRELNSYAKRLKDAGFRNMKLTVDMHSKISYPAINVIMLVIGVSLAAAGTMGGGLITAAIGIFVSLLYWVGYTACLSMGYTGILPPILAAWLMPAVFAGVAFYLFRRIPE